MRVLILAVATIAMLGGCHASTSIGPTHPVMQGPFCARDQFDVVWSTVRDKFCDPRLNGVDWDAMRSKYLPRASKCTNAKDLGGVVNEMLGTLRTSHTQYLTVSDPAYYVISATVELGSKPTRCSVGMEVLRTADGYFVRALYEGDVAQQAGLQIGDRLVSVDGRPFEPVDSFAGKAGRTVDLELQRNADEPVRHISLVPTLIPEPQRLFDAAMQTRIIKVDDLAIAYIRLWWLGNPATQQYFPGLLKGLACGKNHVKAYIIDIRDAYGGGFESYLAALLTPPYGTIRKTPRDPAQATEIPLGGTDLPVVLLVNEGTRSGSELFAYYCKKLGRASLVGERTAGAVAEGQVQRCSTTSFLYYCAAKVDVDDVPLEGHGVEPTVPCPFQIPYCHGIDTQLERAKREAAALVKKRAPH